MSTVPSEPPARVARHPTLLFLLSLLGGLLVYLATDSVGLGAAFPCLYAIWSLLLSAGWLIVVDPDIGRGLVCCLFYIAAACWRAAAAAVASIFLFLVVAPIVGAKPIPAQLNPIMTVVVLGLALNTGFGLLAVVAALLKGVRVWVNPHVRDLWSGRYTLSMLQDQQRLDFNHAVFVTATSLIVPALFLGSVCLALGVGPDPNHTPLVPGIIGCVMFLICPIAAIPLYAFVSRRIIARSPAECWPPDVLPHAEQEDPSSALKM